MRRLSLVALVLALAAAVGCKRNPPAPAPGTFSVGKATTYITGPLDTDGRVDYAAALNERLSRGVIPENNANVLLWKAIGPHPEGPNTASPALFERLGMPVPSADGEYFLRRERYAREANPGAAELTADTLSELARTPWTAAEHPAAAGWLKGNEKPLALAVEAAGRTHFFSPLIPGRNEKGSTGLWTAPLPGIQATREIALALAARAMLAAGDGRADDAWADLIACHRLGRLVGRGGLLIEGVVGVAIEQIACRAELAFLQHASPDAKRLERYLGDLRALAPPRGVAELVESERYAYLDTVMTVDRQGGIEFLRVLGDRAPSATAWADRVFDATDWNPALELGNQWYDRAVAAAGETDRARRVELLAAYERAGSELWETIRSPGGAEEVLRDREQSANARGRAVGKVLVVTLMTGVRKIDEAYDRAAQTFANTTVAFALALYRRENGRYPERLDALAPKYLAKAPTDLFSGQPLVYRPTANGYVLYSVGVNGTDDGGRGHEDRPQGDDLVVRVSR